MRGRLRFLAIPVISAISIAATSASGQQPPDVKSSGDQPDSAKGLMLDDLPTLFVPAKPESVEDRKKTELAELFVTARAHELSRQWTEALEILDKCAKLDPENLAVLKRQVRLNFALGKMEPGLQAARKVLSLEPDDANTLRLLVTYYERRNQFPQAEKLLSETLANPKLDQKSQAALYAHFARGLLFAGRLQQPNKAVDELIKVMDLLDDKQSGLGNSPEATRILGADPSRMYLNFGRVFVATKKWDQAARAFQRSLSYNPDDTLSVVLLVTALLEDKKPQLALEQLEQAIRRKPQGRESYELLGRVLTALNKASEIKPRLEALNQSTPNNPGIISVLADQYRDAGDNDKARALYEQLVKIQPDPQGLGALASSLIKDKKYDGFLDLLSRAMARPGGLESVRPQIEALAVKQDDARAVLAAAIKKLEPNPGSFQKPTYNSLFYLARQAEQWDQLITLRNLAAKADPSAESLRELALTYYENGQFADAARVMTEIFDKFPNEKDRRNLVTLAQFQMQAKQTKEALDTIDKVLAGDPNDPSALRMKCYILSEMNKFDDALKIGRGILAKAPEDSDFNPIVGSILVRAEKDQEAIDFYRAILRQFPANNELARVAHSGLSVVYVNRDDFINGEKELEELLKRTPDDAGVNNDLGYLYADQGKKLEDAEAMIRKAVTDEPDNSAYLDSLAWVLYKRGKSDEALNYMEKAIAIARRLGQEGTLLDHYGDILFRLKKFDRAKQAWQEALKHVEPNKTGEKLAKSIKMKLENVERIPIKANSTGDANP